MLPHDAIVLAGGGARRMVGVDKLAAVVGGRSLLDRALDATAGAGIVLVVGSRRPAGSHSVTWVDETRPGGGPAAAISAALPAVTAPAVLLLAGDMPFATTAVPRLLSALAGAEAAGAVLVDAGGRRQPLLAVYRTEALRAAVAGTGAGDLHGTSVRALIAGLPLVEVEALGSEAVDCDTPAALDLARRLAAGAGAWSS